MKKIKKYDTGGNLLQTILPAAISLIPGAAPFAPLVNPILNGILGNQDNKPQPQTPVNYTQNPLGRMAYGGPIQPITQDTLRVNPQPFLPTSIQVPNTLPPLVNQASPITPLPDFSNTLMGNRGSYSLSKRRYREHENGGYVNDNFKQYDTGSHNSGNDLIIDQNGNPNLDGQASVQNKENMYNGFVMSDTLKNPETGNTFNIDAMKVNKKYKDSRLYEDSKNALQFELGRLQSLNQAQIDSKQKTSQMAIGGNPKSIYDLGLSYDNNTDPLTTLNENLPYNQDPILGVNQPVSTFTPIPQDTATYNQSVNNPSLNLGTNLNLQTPRFNGNGRANPRSNPNGFNDPLNALAIGFKGAALAGSVYDALQPAQHENLVLPNYGPANNYMREANVDYSQAKQDSMGVSNQQSNEIRNAGGSYGAYASRQSGRLAQLQDSLSRISEGQANAQSQLNLQKGQYEANKAVDTANRTYQNNTDNLQNQARSRDFSRVLSSDFSQIGTTLSEQAAGYKAIENQKQIANFNNNQILSILNSKFPNWQLNPDLVEKFKKGQIDMNEILKYTK